MGRPVGNVAAIEVNRPTGGPNLAANDIKQCGFSRTVGSDDAKDFLFADGETDIRENSPSPILFAHLHQV
jgi:hypothetical protein